MFGSVNVKIIPDFSSKTESESEICAGYGSMGFGGYKWGVQITKIFA